MPAKSAAQQKLFGMVHAYQSGKIPADKVSAKIKHVSKHISPTAAADYARGSTKDLPENILELFTSPEYVELSLREIVNTNEPAAIKGILIDIFTANLVLTVLSRLNENNRASLLSSTVEEMVALSYRIVTQ